MKQGTVIKFKLNGTLVTGKITGRVNLNGNMVYITEVDSEVIKIVAPDYEYTNLIVQEFQIIK